MFSIAIPWYHAPLSLAITFRPPLLHFSLLPLSLLTTTFVSWSYNWCQVLPVLFPLSFDILRVFLMIIFTLFSLLCFFFRCLYCPSAYLYSSSVSYQPFSLLRFFTAYIVLLRISSVPQDHIHPSLLRFLSPTILYVHVLLIFLKIISTLFPLRFSFVACIVFFHWPGNHHPSNLNACWLLWLANIHLLSLAYHYRVGFFMLFVLAR